MTINRELEKLVKRGNDCYFVENERGDGINIYLQSPTRKISKLVFEFLNTHGYKEEKDCNTIHSQYFMGENLPDVQIIFPKKVQKNA